jgi:hypothetical protein
MLPVCPSRVATGVLLSEGISHILPSAMPYSDLPNAIMPSSSHKVLVGTDGEPVHLFLPSEGVPGMNAPIAAEEESADSKCPTRLPKTGYCGRLSSATRRKGDLQPAVQRMTDMAMWTCSM